MINCRVSYLLLVVGCLLCGLASGTYVWQSCEPTMFSPHSVVMSPDPAEPGRDATFTAIGDLGKEEVAGGSWYAEAYLGKIPVAKFTGEVCGIANCTCPCQGPTGLTAAITLPIPGDSPPGSTIFSVLTAVDQNDNQFFCINGTFKIAT